MFTTAYNIDGLSFNRNELNVDDLMGRQTLVHGGTDSSTRIILIINTHVLLLDGENARNQKRSSGKKGGLFLLALALRNRIKCHRSRRKEAVYSG